MRQDYAAGRKLGVFLEIVTDKGLGKQEGGQRTLADYRRLLARRGDDFF